MLYVLFLLQWTLESLSGETTPCSWSHNNLVLCSLHLVGIWRWSGTYTVQREHQKLDFIGGPRTYFCPRTREWVNPAMVGSLALLVLYSTCQYWSNVTEHSSKTILLSLYCFYRFYCIVRCYILFCTFVSLLPGTEHEPVAPFLQQRVVLALSSQLEPFGKDSWNVSTAYRVRGREERW